MRTKSHLWTLRESIQSPISQRKVKAVNPHTKRGTFCQSTAKSLRKRRARVALQHFCQPYLSNSLGWSHFPLSSKLRNPLGGEAPRGKLLTVSISAPPHPRMYPNHPMLHHHIMPLTSCSLQTVLSKRTTALGDSKEAESGNVKQQEHTQTKKWWEAGKCTAKEKGQTRHRHKQELGVLCIIS